MRETLINSFNEEQNAKIIAGINYSDTRLLVAKKLDQLNALELARKFLKGKDKRAEKVIRLKLEQYRSQQKLRDTVDRDAQTLCEQLEFIAQHPEWRSEFKDKYQNYLSKWDLLKLEPIDTHQQRFDAAKELASKHVARQISLEQQRQAQIDIGDKLFRYSNSLSTLECDHLIAERLSINTVLSEALATWLELNAPETAHASTISRFQQAQQSLSRLATLLELVELEHYDLASNKLKELKWPIEYTALSALPQLELLLNSQKQLKESSQREYKNTLDALHKRINRLLGTSNKGDLKKAKYELSACSKAAEKYSGRDGNLLSERIEAATELVSKMNDWQDFATEPKLIELCQAMEKLSSSKAKPDKLAKQISELQNDWKKLASSDISEQHWPRFKEAADKAYEPCSRFFEARKLIQTENLKSREPILEAMQALHNDTDWENVADWKALESKVRNLSNQWREIKNVDPKLGKKQWSEFANIRQCVYDKFDTTYDANIALKETIIRQTKALLELEASETSLEKLKLYQSRWKQVGITRRKQDQQAWSEFRKLSDALFENLKANRNQARKQQDAEVEAYTEITKKINALAKTADSIAVAEPKFEQYCSDFQALPELPQSLPERMVERVHNEFQRAQSNYSKARERIEKQAQDNVLKQLREKADLCGELERAYFEQKTEYASKIEQQLTALKIDDLSIEKRFQTRLDTANEADRTEANELRRAICIDLEVFLNIESPTEDKALRMQRQLARMSDEGLGASSLDRELKLKQFKLDWLCSAGAEPETQTKLDKRFWASIEQA